MAKIVEALPQLTNAELQLVEKRVLMEYRNRKVGIIFDDAYGLLTEADLSAIQEDALAVCEGPLVRPLPL